MALGEDVRPDYRALPRATYTDPEAASVGVTLDQALADGLDAFELVADFATTAKGYAVEATIGHVTIVVDRRSRQLVGAAMACPDASAAIHECVLAIKAGVPVDVLAETIHAFPSTSRILNGLFADARRELDRPGSVVGATASRSKTTSPSIRTIVGRVVASAPPGSTGSSMAAAADDHDVGALAGRQPPAVGLAGRDAPDRRTALAAPGRA